MWCASSDVASEQPWQSSTAGLSGAVLVDGKQ